MNETAVDASTVHGTNPQFLIEKITRYYNSYKLKILIINMIIIRLKVYSCIYWKEKCFGLTAETLLDRAITIK
jgi:pre-mRNA-splicing factor 38A